VRVPLAVLVLSECWSPCLVTLVMGRGACVQVIKKLVKTVAHRVVKVAAETNNECTAIFVDKLKRRPVASRATEGKQAAARFSTTVRFVTSARVTPKGAQEAKKKIKEMLASLQTLVNKDTTAVEFIAAPEPKTPSLAATASASPSDEWSDGENDEGDGHAVGLASDTHCAQGLSTWQHAARKEQGLAGPHKRFPARLLLGTVRRKGP
jgi:hypothetical protein